MHIDIAKIWMSQGENPVVEVEEIELLAGLPSNLQAMVHGHPDAECADGLMADRGVALDDFDRG
jgi:hypothetical protein